MQRSEDWKAQALLNISLIVKQRKYRQKVSRTKRRSLPVLLHQSHSRILDHLIGYTPFLLSILPRNSLTCLTSLSRLKGF